MKKRTIVPILTFCLGSSLWLSSALTDDLDSTRTGKLPGATLGKPCSLSQVMDATVKDAQGDTLGQIKDVVLDPATGRATFAIIQLGGDVGPRGSFTPIPWALLNPTDQKTYTLNVDRDRFASADRFYLKQWPDSNQDTWAPQVYSYYGLDSSILGFRAGGTGSNIDTGSGSSYSYQRRMSRYGPTRADGTPIDNGTAPDGKGTFVKGPRYWSF